MPALIFFRYSLRVSHDAVSQKPRRLFGREKPIAVKKYEALISSTKLLVQHVFDIRPVHRTANFHAQKFVQVQVTVCIRLCANSARKGSTLSRNAVPPDVNLFSSFLLR